MRKLAALVLGLAIFGCQESEQPVGEFTGNEVTYALQAGSVYVVSGVATIKEKKDGSAQVVINLTGTEGTAQLPVHVHLGNISEADADVAALLNPINAANGKSETIVKQLADETPVTYAELVDINACIKIHLAETGPERDIILAAGNIGKAALDAASGRASIGVCKSN
ncbi:MAG: hypothetical protein QY309_12405 [Cyclobacteriaceae bacterium]|nr:MAG: hypothetical protein QY309_12405 [Cyclobacteriaceae bacterium]